MEQQRLGLIRKLGIFLVVTLLALTLVLVADYGSMRLSLTLDGPEELIVDYGTVYLEPGVSVERLGSVFFGDLPSEETEITVDGAVDTDTVGTYILTYSVSSRGLHASAQRTVRVVDRIAPELILEGPEEIYLHPGEIFEEPGFSAWDGYDGDLSAVVEVTEEGESICYRVTDAGGNVAETRRVIHYDDSTPPRILLTEGLYLRMYAGTSFTDPGFTAEDNADGDLTESVITQGTVNIWFPGCYTLIYSVTDSYGNTTSVKRVVQVDPQSPPVEIEPEEKVIYLTFDDGPGPYTRQLLAILAKYDAKATFFVVCNKYEDIVSEIAAAGHAVGIHTACHEYRTIYASEEAYFADLQQVQDMILRQTGQTTTLLRFPGGSSNKVSRFNKGIMTRLTAAVQAAGFQYYDWNVDSNDAGGAKTATEVYRNVTRSIGSRKVAIVLQHDIKGFSVDAVERILIWGLTNGYTFRALDFSSPGCHHGIRN
jgi:peptidoglycan/xylan/chitin deacetylase (PgdA/CDA1 family)